LILEAPFTSVAEVAQSHFPYVPASRMVIDRFESLSRNGRVKAPILVLHGERDRVVPVRYGRALLEAAPDPKEGWFAPEAGHEDLARYGRLNVVVAFIERPARRIARSAGSYSFCQTNLTIQFVPLAPICAMSGGSAHLYCPMTMP
jgi:hypothetical protein